MQMVHKSAPKAKPKPKLTDAAKEVKASDKAEDFDWVFDMAPKKKAP